MYEQLAEALSFLYHVFVETDNTRHPGRGRFDLKNPLPRFRTSAGFSATEPSWLRGLLQACLSHSTGTPGKRLDGLVLNVIHVFVSLMDNLHPGQQLVVPGS